MVRAYFLCLIFQYFPRADLFISGIRLIVENISEFIYAFQPRGSALLSPTTASRHFYLIFVLINAGRTRNIAKNGRAPSRSHLREMNPS